MAFRVCPKGDPPPAAQDTPQSGHLDRAAASLNGRAGELLQLLLFHREQLPGNRRYPFYQLRIASDEGLQERVIRKFRLVCRKTRLISQTATARHQIEDRAADEGIYIGAEASEESRLLSGTMIGETFEDRAQYDRRCSSVCGSKIPKKRVRPLVTVGPEQHGDIHCFVIRAAPSGNEAAR